MSSIFIDPRVGSVELVPYFRPYDIPVELVQLDAADAAFVGNGPDGPCYVGFERKVLGDAVQSMRSERFVGEQLPKLIEQYTSITMVVEGIWRAGPETGMVEVRGNREWFGVRTGNRGVMYRELDHWLATLEYVVDHDIKGLGKTFKVVRTADAAQTVAYLVSRYKWWNDKEWEQHGSFRGIYSPECPPPLNARRGMLSMPKAGPVEDVAARFPGVKAKAWGFGKVFGSVREMVNADEKRLMTVEGVGKKMANTIYHWLRGGPS